MENQEEPWKRVAGLNIDQRTKLDTRAAVARRLDAVQTRLDVLQSSPFAAATSGGGASIHSFSPDSVTHYLLPFMVTWPP